MYRISKNPMSGEEIGVVRLSDNAHIPNDLGNGDWLGYLKWVEEGNTPDPAIIFKSHPAISDRQFFQQLAVLNVITEEEAEEAVGPGTIPASMVTLINQLPENMRFDARMKLRGATVFNRNSPLVGLLGQLYGWNEKQIDDLWDEAALL
jgi:hypothetical protein